MLVRALSASRYWRVTYSRLHPREFDAVPGDVPRTAAHASVAVAHSATSPCRLGETNARPHGAAMARTCTLVGRGHIVRARHAPGITRFRLPTLAHLAAAPRRTQRYAAVHSSW